VNYKRNVTSAVFDIGLGWLVGWMVGWLVGWLVGWFTTEIETGLNKTTGAALLRQLL